MTVYFHELKRNKLSVIIWSAAIAAMLLMCVVMYPMMEPYMNDLGTIAANMGGLSEAMDMDQLGFGSFDGYFALECGEMLGLGGCLFAAILGIGALSKEEKDRTAEFLLTHPVSRSDIVDEKLLAVLTQVTVLNVVVAVLNVLGILAIGEGECLKDIWLLFVAYYLMQMQIAAVTFGLSALLHKGALPIGLGVGFGFYFLNIVANLAEELEFLKFLTPFGYCEGSWILQEHSLQWKYLAVGAGMAIAAVVLAFWKYQRKDINA